MEKPETNKNNRDLHSPRFRLQLTAMQKKLLSSLVALILIGFVFSILTSGQFIEARNISNLVRQTAINGILAVGMTWVILLSGVDLSVGSVTAFVGIVVAISQTSWGWSTNGITGIIMSIGLALGVGAIIGAINGFWIAKMGIHSFVITFGMMVIARGLAMIASDGQSISPMGPEFNHLGAGYISSYHMSLIFLAVGGIWVVSTIKGYFRSKSVCGDSASAVKPLVKASLVILGLSSFYWVCSSYQGLPVPVLIFGLVAILGNWVLKKTRFGRYIYSTGGNYEAARLAGVPVRKVVFFVFLTMSALAALCGVILSARLNGATPTAGNLFELDAIAAVVIGGTSLKGGKGSVVGSLIGALIIESLNNGMSLLNVPTFYQMPLKGAIVILAVAIDSVVEKKKA